MPAFGGFAPWPRRFGGGAPLLQRVFESVSAARGSAYDQTSPTNNAPLSAVGVENMALARAIVFDGYYVNEKMRNEFMPDRCTAAGLLPRWERIFQQFPNYLDTEPVRRARIQAAWTRLVRGNWIQAVIDVLQAGLGALYSTIVFQTPSTAVTSWPGGTLAPGLPWMSSIFLVSVQLTIPAGYANSDGTPNALWWAAAGSVAQNLDPLLPAWCTYQFYALSTIHGTTGFYLDEPDLDLLVFDV